MTLTLFGRPMGVQIGNSADLSNGFACSYSLSLIVKSNTGPTRGPVFDLMAEWTGLEPATPGVTGRYSNQLNYHSVSGGC